MVHPPNASKPPRPGQKSALKVMARTILGGALGLPLGFLGYMLAREFILPTTLWSSDRVMWAIIAAIVALCSAAGAAPAILANRPAEIALSVVRGFALGALLGTVASVVVALALGALFQVSQREGAFAMGVLFTIAPLGGLMGGVILALDPASSNGKRRERRPRLNRLAPKLTYFLSASSYSRVA